MPNTADGFDYAGETVTLSLTDDQLLRITEALVTERHKLEELRDWPGMAESPDHRRHYDRWIGQVESIMPLLPEWAQKIIHEAVRVTASPPNPDHVPHTREESCDDEISH
ncbi:MAG TPA: hypothetical protein VEF72_12090 [Mycobacterium sp.]|nr:hypothetical protein [Mycobacterium sp.]